MEENKVILTKRKFWIIISLVALLGIGVGITLDNNSTQAPIIIETN